MASRIRPFLARCLRFRAVSPAIDSEGAAEWWRGLGVQAEMVELLVEVDPAYHEGCLWVNGELENTPDVYEKVGSVMLSVSLASPHRYPLALNGPQREVCHWGMLRGSRAPH